MSAYPLMSLDEVRRIVAEAAPDGVAPRPDDRVMWHQFFRLQSAYLLLWSVVERYTALRFGPGLNPSDRVRRLDNDPAFRQAVASAGVSPGVVYNSRDPEDRSRVTTDGDRAADFFYRIRSNLTHRGKGAFQDSRLVFEATTALHDAMRTLLASQAPDLQESWRVLANGESVYLRS